MTKSMLVMARRNRALVVITLLFALAACSDDAGSNGNGTADTGDTGTNDGAAGDTGGAPTWSAQLYRVDELVIDQPAGLGVIIGELVNRDIQSGLLNILIETGTFASDTGDTTFEIRGGAGETTDGTTYALVNDVDWVTAAVEAAGGFENTELLVLDFPVILTLPPDCGQEDCPDDRCRNDDDCSSPYTCDSDGDGQCAQGVVLPLKDIQIDGTFTVDDDGNPVIQLAQLDGAILKEDADQIVVGLPGADPVLLTDLLQEERMNYPAEGEPTGWQLSALINATAVARAE